jgi:hypothetical protein
MATVHFAKLGGLRPGNVNLLSRKRTVRGRDLEGVRVDEDGVDALGLFEVLDIAIAG